MAAKFKFLGLYFISWLVFFNLLRIVFLLYHHDKTALLPGTTILQTFVYGLRMDLSVAAYILAPICLFVILSLFIRFFQRLTVYKWYTFILLLLVAIISLADLEIYNAWGFRIDSTPLSFLGTPREAFASMSHLPIFAILVVFLLCYALFYFCFRFILRRIFFQQQNRYKLLTGFLVLLLAGSLIIPIRGGLQLAPLNQSSVYFSKHNFANHAAINASWNFLHSLFSKGNSRRNPFQYFSMPQAMAISDSLYSQKSIPGSFVEFNSDTATNVILVIWESFTSKVVGQKHEGLEITPGFNRLLKEGIYFSQAYASGDRTNKGVPAILSGYPAMPSTTIIHSPNKSVKLNVLSQLFRDRGYATPFFYGGEPEFANIKSYLLHAGFDPIIGKDDFASRDMNSKWGAHDGVVATRVLKDLGNIKQPFFSTWLTLSSHEPFETPVPSIFKGADPTSQFLNSIHYADKAVTDFVKHCRQQSWWDNTVLIIVGDHGHPLPASPDKADDFRTPIVWLGGALKKDSLQFDFPISQLDIAAMLCGQAGFDKGLFPFSKDAFDPATRHWAFFNFNNGFGFIDSTGRVIFDNVGKIPIRQDGGGPAHIRAGQAMMQRVYEDFIKK